LTSINLIKLNKSTRNKREDLIKTKKVITNKILITEKGKRKKR